MRKHWRHHHPVHFEGYNSAQDWGNSGFKFRHGIQKTVIKKSVLQKLLKQGNALFWLDIDAWKAMKTEQELPEHGTGGKDWRKNKTDLKFYSYRLDAPLFGKRKGWKFGKHLWEFIWIPTLDLVKLLEKELAWITFDHETWEAAVNAFRGKKPSQESDKKKLQDRISQLKKQLAPELERIKNGEKPRRHVRAKVEELQQLEERLKAA